MSDTVLAVEDLGVRYGGVVAVNGLSLALRSGELVSLIGPNGAGKTSAVDGITGYVRAHGVVRLRGSDISASPPHLRARAGLVRTFQQLELFDDLTVSENLGIAAGRGGRGDVNRVLGLFGLAPFARTRPLDLPQGTRRLVAIARGLVSGPSVLVLDEPAAGLSPDDSSFLGSVLRQLVADGLAILLIEHDMPLVLSISDRVIVVDAGAVIAEGPPDQVRENEVVLKAYLGDPV